MKSKTFNNILVYKYQIQISHDFIIENSNINSLNTHIIDYYVIPKIWIIKIYIIRWKPKSNYLVNFINSFN